ncbi:hypothetical protein KAM398_20530 [Acinetobacter sp. KAM398]|nr:hypothetical protein KAM392_20530 [Acinetobacter sp. KAM392]GJC34881.1 hypothetical protein KAM393_20500 [Acinetobacter sp. KAM393]GJC37704.1 hypothetical protein KAM394_20440 [Acinetobacter sp. KAM394]GJC40529.1 hypothetical protein KAM395_20500 [Acinetobacter sp. KAM395]GJC43358.1 hypothetical protein KAM396_20550 [Acinetobacter sp. KAM396]GJC44746.1 hypothetical protein KAM397_06260 [Acinetobacter sp. KAM397]GJC49001.1 hypothetical protein KAM398_20530 [Acinetobacter sp. KAM398]GJC5176
MICICSIFRDNFIATWVQDVLFLLENATKRQAEEWSESQFRCYETTNKAKFKITCTGKYV